MKKILLIIGLVCILFLAGCLTTKHMKVEEALKIADEYECLYLTGEYFYDEKEQIWQFKEDLLIDKCASICFVYEKTRKAERRLMCAPGYIDQIKWQKK